MEYFNPSWYISTQCFLCCSTRTAYAWSWQSHNTNNNNLPPSHSTNREKEIVDEWVGERTPNETINLLPLSIDDGQLTLFLLCKCPFIVCNLITIFILVIVSTSLVYAKHIATHHQIRNRKFSRDADCLCAPNPIWSKARQMPEHLQGNSQGSRITYTLMQTKSEVEYGE